MMKDFRQFEEFVKHIEGNTYTFSYEGVCVVIYICDGSRAVLIDSGYEEHGEMIGEFLAEQGLSLAGIIHSHIHIDHYSGNEMLLQSEAAGRHVPIYIPTFEHPYVEIEETEFFDFENADVEAYEGRSEIRVGGATFRIIDCYGHSSDSKILITPDGVAYLGDALMCGDMMTRARMPYAYDLVADIKAKQALRELGYEKYVCSHCGDFAAAELDAVVEANLKIMVRALEYARKTEAKCPGMENMQKARRMLKYMGLPQFVDTDWVVNTVVQYFEDRDEIEKLLGDIGQIE